MIAALVILSISNFVFGVLAVAFCASTVMATKDVKAKDEYIEMLIGDHDVLELRAKKEDEEA